MKWRFAVLTLLVPTLAASVALLAPAAAAQTGYPPGACTTTSGDSGNVGSGPVGGTITFSLRAVCQFTPGGTAAVVVNGEDAGTKVVSADGGVPITVNVLSTTQLSVNPTVRGQCGRNTVSATGRSESAGTNVTQRGEFTVVCATAAATPSKGRIALTGGDIIRWSGAALVLFVLGGGLVLAARRRSAGGIQAP